MSAGGAGSLLNAAALVHTPASPAQVVRQLVELEELIQGCQVLLLLHSSSVHVGGMLTHLANNAVVPTPMQGQLSYALPPQAHTHALHTLSHTLQR